MTKKLKVLVIRFSSIGDIVLTTPVLRCINSQLNVSIDFLTKDKYNELGIKLYDKDFNEVELPAPPKILTEWEIKKFGLKDTGYKPIEIEPKKLIQFV